MLAILFGFPMFTSIEFAFLSFFTFFPHWRLTYKPVLVTPFCFYHVPMMLTSSHFQSMKDSLFFARYHI